jgi:primosomal protein N' (replication factor Y)
LNTAALVATVAVAAPIDKALSYSVPERLREKVRVGTRLRVPLGRRRAIGYVLALAPGDPAGLKEIGEVFDEPPLFPPALAPFFLRVADYYRYPLGEVVRTALPAGLSGAEGRLSVLRERVFSAAPGSDRPSGAKQREILAWIRERGASPLTDLRERFGAPHPQLNRLVEQGFLVESGEERRRDPFFSLPVAPDEEVTLTAEQARALTSLAEATEEGGFSPFLLHGVTGSGKTEVYLRAIARVLEKGRGALVLVPEIALTPQLVGRFRARFQALDSGTVAVLHSGLSEGERYDAWRAIARGEARIVIGARSAVFAPLGDLGIVVVDEEHEGSYKQGEGFRYHGRDLALLRGQMEGAVVLLGSATPALTTFHRALTGKTGYLALTERVRSRPLPPVELVDLRDHPAEGTLSPPLTGALEEVLGRGEQALILLNRRGFAPFLLCTDCGATFRCPNCDITLTYHQGARRLRCHYCDYTVSPPMACPHCGGIEIRPEGAGTERLEEDLSALFPQARIARMDRDTTARKGAHQHLVERVMKKEVDLLLGTQMIAKGHDFPGVTLVGVINADTTLNFPDFRSAERAFALFSQVAGRAGRGERPGRVLIQTYAPEHYALTCAAAHDYRQFYELELAGRRELGYPPFGFLVNLVLAGNEAERVGRAALRLGEALAQAAGEVEVLGPAPCPLARLRGKSRQQILLKAAARLPLRQLLGQLATWRSAVPPGVKLTVDVDPVDML